MRATARFWVAVIVVAMIGCDDSSGSDAGPGGSDAGSDAGAVGMDAGMADAGAIEADAGSVDSGSVDSGMADAGMRDAGMADAGMPDAGMADAGMRDAGMADAGMRDAGPASCTPTVSMSDPRYNRYEGIGFNNTCVTSADCMRSGCSSEVCAAEAIATTCEVVPIPAGSCQCSAGTCIWASGVCGP